MARALCGNPTSPENVPKDQWDPPSPHNRFLSLSACSPVGPSARISRKFKKMEAAIVLINETRNLAAARTEHGKFVVFQLLGAYALELGDVVSHSDLHEMEGVTYRNLTRNRRMSVYVQTV